MQAKYKRILLKLSGEALGAAGEGGFDPAAIEFTVRELGALVQAGVQVGLVIGGGNILRGRDLKGLKAIARVTGDYMGMLATIMNGIALRDSLQSAGIKATVLSSIHDVRICEPFSATRATELLQSGHVVIFAGGTGSPFFTTDTCAALRASEVGADVLMKATTVDGVYDSDPRKNPAAKKYDRLSYDKVLADRLGVMDLTAISICMESRLPILVFRFAQSGNLAAAVIGENVGTVIGAQ